MRYYTRMTDDSLDFSEFLDDEPAQPERVVVPRDTRSAQTKARQEKFIDVALATGNYAEAARQVGFRQERLPESPYLRKTLAERRAQYQEQYEVTPENVIRGHARVAFFDPRNLVDDEGNTLDLNELDDETAMAIGGIEITELGRGEGFGKLIKYKPNDRQKALDSLSRKLGLFKEDNEQTRPDTGVFDAMTQNEVARRLAFYLQETVRKQGDGAKEAQAADTNTDGI